MFYFFIKKMMLFWIQNFKKWFFKQKTKKKIIEINLIKF